GIQIEASLVPQYKGETLLPEMVRYAGKLGFTLMSIEPGFHDPDTGQLLQADLIFFRGSAAPKMKAKKFSNPALQFHSDKYLHHNRKRFEHLDSLNIDFSGKKVLEVGAGIGDQTDYLLAKGCSQVLVTEVRPENLAILRDKFAGEPRVQVNRLDMEAPEEIGEKFDICYCFGLLYHLANPEPALEFLSRHTEEMLLLETCVSYQHEDGINLCNEDAGSFSQSVSGKGCRPGRKWIFAQLKKYFDFVYMPITQPDHEQFPTDWTLPEYNLPYARAIFIASRKKLNNPLLIEDIPLRLTNLKEFKK
ncbi:MAG: class I SAM-dependent methyltransferase, partial [Candidatus Aminicenantes bacterium]|nr:class I SAM-dependent methyltransferase [Candidatus Aminicenantes bacterium]